MVLSLAVIPRNTSAQETPPANGEPSPMVGVTLYALGDAPIRKFLRMQGKEAEDALLAEKKAWEAAFPGQPFKPGPQPPSKFEEVNPLEGPPSPLVVDIDKATKSRKFISLDHLSKSYCVVKRIQMLTLNRVYDPPAGAPPGEMMKISKLTDIPIPPTIDEMLVFIVKPPGTYEWTKSVFKTFDVSPKKYSGNSVIIVNLSSFPIAVAQQTESPEHPYQAIATKLEAGEVASKVLQNPSGERICVFSRDTKEQIAGKFITPRENHREVMVIYDMMSGNRDDLKSVPGMQSFALPIKQ